jgi:thiol-disulfide isomerase/thioredoxin
MIKKFKSAFNQALCLAIMFLTVLNCRTVASKEYGYIINGHVDGLKSDSVYLYNTLSNKTEPAVVKEGNFFFAGKIDYPEMYQIYFDAKMSKWIGLFLENSRISVNGNIDFPDSIQIRGSSSNEEYIDYRKSSKQLRSEFRNTDKMFTEAQEKFDYDKADSLEVLNNIAAHRILENVYDYASNHQNSVIIPYITHIASFNAPDKILSNKIFDFLKSDARKNPRVTALDQMIADIVRTAVGSKGADFKMTAKDGKEIRLSAFHGKIVLLDFWASWCEPCIKSFPELEEVYKKYDRNKFEIIGFSIDKKNEEWEKALANYKMPWPQVVELNGPDGPAPKDYGIIFIPTTYLIDKGGKIAGVNLHGKKLINKIQELISL